MVTPPPVTVQDGSATGSRRAIAHGPALVAISLCTAGVLVLTVSSQLFNSNLLLLGESTALLAGDHPYRDFFEIGMPLAAYLSAAAQWLSGQRLIGEFVLQWVFIVAGVAIAFHLGLRLSRSVAASLAVLPLTLAVLAATPTYHYSKLFYFPLIVWLAWRYLDAPGVRRGAVLGVATALAFLHRNDYGIYAGFASVLAVTLGRAVVPSTRDARALVREAAGYAAAVAILVAPWAAVVQSSEGLREYVRTRAALNEPPAANPFTSLLALDPAGELLPPPAPAPKPAVVRFMWQDDVTQTEQRRLEREHGLRRLARPDDRGRRQYAVSNAYDTGLLDLDPYITDGEGFEWDRLRELRWRLPPRDNLALWLQQMALLVPVSLLAVAGWRIARSGLRSVAVPPDAWKMLLAGAFLAVVDTALFRERSYVVVVAPLTAALTTPFLASGRSVIGVAVLVLVLLTTCAGIVWAKDPILRPTANILSEAFGELVATPAAASNPYRYLYECTARGDRLIVTGQTPAFVSFHAQRAFAGGHVYWHTGWRSDPEREAQSLAMIERESVPFAVSTHDPVLTDFSRYPRIQEYLRRHYRELEGTEGKLLVDTRRRPTGRFAPLGYPCFH